MQEAIQKESKEICEVNWNAYHVFDTHARARSVSVWKGDFDR
jgi:hypothetical protein